MLQAVGATGVGASLAPTSIAVADTNKFCPNCPDGTAVIAKYDWDKSKEEFVISDGCNAVTFGPVLLDDDDEPIDVTWESSLFYEGIRVKYGTNCDSFTRDETKLDDNAKDGAYEGNISKADDLEDCKAISHISFCAAPCFQVDFVFGPSISDLGNDDGGFYKARKIVHIWGNTLTGHVTGTSIPYTESRNGCEITAESITVDLSNDPETPSTATVNFTHDGGTCELSLVSYIASCPIGFNESTADKQSLFDEVTDTSVSTDGSFTVNLPQAGDIQALCDEFPGSVI